jgi:thymidylate synthase (FAD)
MTTQAQVASDPKYTPYLDHGFVGLVESMGSDASIDESARMSYGKGTRTISDMRNLIRYLVRHQHTSPVEMGELRFHLKMPIFIMRQFVRHRTASLNEYSGRYSEMSDEFYIPDYSRIQPQSTTNKQGSEGSLPDGAAMLAQNEMIAASDDAYHSYQKLLEAGVSREIARIVLPLSNYTELYWKIDLKNFFHFINLRLDPHAQWEIQVLAQAMYDAVKGIFPITCEAFEDYWLNARSYSAVERNVVKALAGIAHHAGGLELLLSGVKDVLSKREYEELRKELNADDYPKA